MTPEQRRKNILARADRTADPRVAGVLRRLAEEAHTTVDAPPRM